jgi:hypothetical protein
MDATKKRWVASYRKKAMKRGRVFWKVVLFGMAFNLQNALGQDSIVIRIPNVFISSSVDSALKSFKIQINGEEIVLDRGTQTGNDSEFRKSSGELTLEIVDEDDGAIVKIIGKDEDGKEVEKEIVGVDGDTTKQQKKKVSKVIVGPVKIVEYSYEDDEEDEEEEGASEMEVDKEEKKERREKRLETEVFGFEVGWSNWYNPSSGNLGLPSAFSPMKMARGGSGRIGLHFLPTELKLTNRISLTTGILLDLFYFHFIGNSYWAVIDDSLQVVTTPYSLSENKLSMSSVGVPLGLRWKISQKDGIWFRLGGYGSYVLDAKRKIKFEKEKHVRKDDFLLTPLRYGLFVNVGIEWFYIYATQDFNPFFRVGYVPTMQLTSYGIGLDFDF